MMCLNRPVGRLAKRSVDLVASSIGLLLLVPIIAIAALAIKLDDGGSVFFRQVRVGRGGANFLIWKFRTMTEGADLRGPAITAEGDVRVTRVGRLLRRTKMDELPQLINVIFGEMSLVGPRPEVPVFVAGYSADERTLLEVRPGLTDPASLKYMNEGRILSEVREPLEYYRRVILPEKIAMNMAYQREATLLSDFRIILRTLFAVLSRGKLPGTRD